MLRREETKEDIFHTIHSAERTISNQPILKDYGIGAQILRDLGVVKMRLLGEERKIPSISGFGLIVTEFLESPADILTNSEKDNIAKFCHS
jgi:3,4-dihydroxy 2-butanone 4-phosphate synthase / GTP cyclohydrolase II